MGLIWSFELSARGQGRGGGQRSFRSWRRMERGDCGGGVRIVRGCWNDFKRSVFCKFTNVTGSARWNVGEF